MEIKLDVSKTKRMVTLIEPPESYQVIMNSEHMVEDITYVVATRSGKKGFVRVAKSTLKDVK